MRAMDRASKCETAGFKRGLSVGLLAFWLIMPTTLQAEVFARVPKKIDPQKQYLFYLHGAWIERNGLQRPHPQFGEYAYKAIVSALEERGFSVISEARRQRVSLSAYADFVSEQVSALLQAGVPAEKITVVGHSKGGVMALAVASRLRQAELNYAILAGCGIEGTRFGRSYERFVADEASLLKGRLLSLYDAEDAFSGSCSAAFSAATGLITRETRFQTGKGHGLFYQPEAEWIDEVTRWARLND